MGTSGLQSVPGSAVRENQVDGGGVVAALGPGPLPALGIDGLGGADLAQQLGDPVASGSILLAQGVHPKVVSELLGHATIALTLDTYSHVIPSLQQEAAAVVAAAVLDPASMPPQAFPKAQVKAITCGS
jgi:hypothetical protein